MQTFCKYLIGTYLTQYEIDLYAISVAFRSHQNQPRTQSPYDDAFQLSSCSLIDQKFYDVKVSLCFK